MPIYEFRCQACTQTFEAIVPAARDAASVSCRHCQSADVTRLLSTFAVSTSGGASSLPAMGGGCGRCGDPQGPCGAN